MRFEWDSEKDHINQKKHGISFENAQTIFNDPLALTIPDKKHSNAEERWITIGQLERGPILVVVIHTFRDTKTEEIIRLISARRATPSERKQYMNS